MVVGSHKKDVTLENTVIEPHALVPSVAVGKENSKNNGKGVEDDKHQEHCNTIASLSPSTYHVSPAKTYIFSASKPGCMKASRRGKVVRKKIFQQLALQRIPDILERFFSKNLKHISTIYI
ncbi:hypothetical protein BVRB_6g151960 [Beta vulgaris subsp. vulgaris]|nr:hypothetical protein BVRB_6g151960 [Beta vulgaris subsp. vulgaris]